MKILKVKINFIKFTKNLDKNKKLWYNTYKLRKRCCKMKNKYNVIYSNKIEDGTAVFGKLNNDLYFLGNEYGIILYNANIENLFQNDYDCDKIDDEYMIGSIDDISYDYLKIMKQTEFYTSKEMKELEKCLGGIEND